MNRRITAAAFLLATTACGTEVDSTPDPPSEPTVTATVAITAPEPGETIVGPDVTVRLAASGVRIVLAGDTTTGTGHHHLFLDDDISPAGQPIPVVPGRVVHMGDGSAEYVFTDVPAGEHRLIAVVADGVHVPLQPWVADTVVFTVRR